MDNGLLIALLVTTVSGWFVIEGLLKGVVVALPVRFERARTPIAFWFVIALYAFTTAIIWLAWISQLYSS
jgi:hypothetical protein